MLSRGKEAYVEVSVKNIQYNLDTVRNVVGDKVKICAVLKADAYGHGMMGLRQSLAAHKLADMFAIGKMSELIMMSPLIKQDKIDTLILGAVPAKEIEEAIQNDLIDLQHSFFSVYSLKQFQDLRELAKRRSVVIFVHLRVDGWNSGMGIGYKEFLDNRELLLTSDNVKACGLYSHLYTSYSENRGGVADELKRFDSFLDGIEDKYKENLTIHILNSSIVYAYPEYSYSMVRLGTAMYGLPYDTPVALKPAMRICAEVFAVKEIDKGVHLFYEHDAEKNQKRRIARIMLGYWDCPLLLTQNSVKIKIRDRVFDLADDICMDNLCIDVTGAEDISVGDLAVIMGDEGVTISEIMDRTGVTYSRSEMLCLTAHRLEKHYLWEE